MQDPLDSLPASLASKVGSELDRTPVVLGKAGLTDWTGQIGCTLVLGEFVELVGLTCGTVWRV